MNARDPEAVLCEVASNGRVTRIEWLGRIAAVVLVSVFVLFAAFAIATTNLVKRTAGEVDAHRALTDRFRTAQYALVMERSLEREYRLEPDGSIFTEHRIAADKLIAAMNAVKAMSDAPERRAVDLILAQHRSYLDATRRLFVATNRNDAASIAAIQNDQVDLAFDRIDDAIADRLRRQAAIARDATERMRAVQDGVIDITVVLSLIGLGCLGCFLRIVSVYRRRITRLHDAELQKLVETSSLDPLTGIGNHRAFKGDLSAEISRAQRHGETLTLALLDVDDFKVVNDRNGHLHGDDVLVAVARMLSLRAEDRAYRIGGDEFAVILPHTTIEGAKELFNRLQVTASAKLFGNTLSIGLATSFGPEYDAEVLQSQADAAMYAAKRSGRNTITAFDAALDGTWLLSPTKVHNLRGLIAARAVSVVFQPIWDLQHCRILAYEALSRPDPDYGFGGPQDAFDLAERMGRAHELDTVCREAAFSQARHLPPDALLFVNVSPQSLDHARLDAGRLAQTVRLAGLSPDRVVLEITERSIVQTAALVAAALELRSHGFRLALDDTGAGNAGLEMMSRLSLDFVKIDREVVVRALVDRTARGVVAGIVAIARASDAYVIAEGIETRAMLEFACGDVSLRSDGSRDIAGVQGYLLSRPREHFLEPADIRETTALLREFASLQTPSAVA